MHARTHPAPFRTCEYTTHQVLRAAAEDAAASLNGVASLRAPDAYFPLPLLWEGLGGKDAAGEGKVRIGYMSSDIKLSHPIGQLLVPVLQAHQSARTAAVCVCIDTHEQGLARSPAAWQQQVHASCAGGFLHLQGHAAGRAAEAINALGVHVLVNLNGWAGEDRLDVLTYRPAPLQVCPHPPRVCACSHCLERASTFCSRHSVPNVTAAWAPPVEAIFPAKSS